jgi:hypothetical protein
MREVMSRSSRSLMTHAATVFITGFVPGVWDDKPKDLPYQCDLAHRIMEKFMGFPMRPRRGHLVLNMDDSGRMVYEGTETQMQAKRQKVGKASKVGVERETRQVSSLWRRQAPHEPLCTGVKCKYKVLASASGHLAPIVLIFMACRKTICLSHSFVLKLKV